VDVSIKYPFDETDKYKQALDRYITDRSIIELLKLTWPSEVNQNFYVNHSSVARHSFFSQPYPKIAVQELGYPICKTWDMATKNNGGRIYKK